MILQVCSKISSFCHMYNNNKTSTTSITLLSRLEWSWIFIWLLVFWNLKQLTPSSGTQYQRIIKKKLSVNTFRSLLWAFSDNVAFPKRTCGKLVSRLCRRFAGMHYLFCIICFWNISCMESLIFHQKLLNK